MHDDDFIAMLRYQPCEFSKVLISRRLDRTFQELSLKKNYKKNIISSDVEVYYTLIVLNSLSFSPVILD